MIADDDPAVEDVLSEMVEYGGFHTLAIDAPYLLEMQEKDLPDLILLDVWMRGTDGREVCRILKSRELTRHIPIIIISASKGIQHSALQAGADGFLEKPFEMVSLMEKIETCLASAPSRDRV
jgi:CheY-like chemotaxis protein